MKRLLLALAWLVVTMACGSPTTPSPANVVGTWSGTWEGSSGIFALLMQLNQTTSTVTGTWVLTDLNWNGNVTGTVDASSFTGNLTINTPRVGGGTCSGTGSFTGGAGAATMKWTAVGFTGTCTFPTTITFNVQRR